MIKKRLRISIVINILLFSILAFVFIGKKDSTKKNENSEIECLYNLKHFNFHYTYESDSASILMIGNSLIKQGDWTTLLQREDVLNRGISGDVLHCICERLKYLENTNAKIWIIEGGINDIDPRKNTDINNLYLSFIEIVNFAKSKNAIPIINLTLYINKSAGNNWEYRKDYKKINNDVKILNGLLLEYAQKNNINYIDLNTSLSKDMELLPYYTTDGIHLNEKAYQIWAKEIKDIIKHYKI